MKHFGSCKFCNYKRYGTLLQTTTANDTQKSVFPPRTLDPSGLDYLSEFPTSSINVDGDEIQQGKVQRDDVVSVDRRIPSDEKRSVTFPLGNAKFTGASGVAIWTENPDGGTLNREGHATTVHLDLHGNYLPANLHGAEAIPASETDMRVFTEHVSDSCHTRPLSSRKYRAVCFGSFITAEAIRRANFNVAFAATKHNRRPFWSHLGVNAENSVADTVSTIPADMMLAAFSCDTKAAFDSIVSYLNRDKVASFFFDTWPEALSPTSGTEKLILAALKDAGYVVKSGIVGAKQFGVCASMERGQVIGIRKDIAESVGFTEGHIPQGPICNSKPKLKCVADLIKNRQADIEDGQVDLDEWVESRWSSDGESYEIHWCEDMKSKKDSILRVEAISAGEPITLGYVHKKDSPVKKEAGFRIGHVYGLLHEASGPEEDPGPGRGHSFYWDPLTDKITTLSANTLKRIWHVEELEDVDTNDLRDVSHPLASCSSMELLALNLDKHFALTKGVPPTPRIRFTKITDVYTPAALQKIKSWVGRVEKWTKWVRASGSKSQAPKPLVMGDEALQFWARGRTFKIVEGVPFRTERPTRPGHTINLHLLPMMADYHDLDIMTIADYIGFACGSNPAMKVVLHANDCGFIENEDEALKTFETDLSFGWAKFSRSIPHCPIWCSPHFLLWQSTKWRRIYNYSKLSHGLSVNQQRAFFKSAALELVSLTWLSLELLNAAKKIVFLRERGISAICLLFVVDLFKAYNQFAVDARDQWHTCSTVVDKEGLLKFIELLVTSFGPEKAPQTFSRITMAANYSSDQQLNVAKDYILQEEYRRLRKRDTKTIEESPSYDIDGLPRLQVTVSQKKETKNARDLNALLPEWECEEEVKRLLPNIQLLRPGPSISKSDVEKLYAIATYLDDCFGYFIVSTAMGGRRPHADGQVKSNSSVVRINKKRRIGASGVEQAEMLRHRYIRGTYEKAGLKVVSEGDDRSLRKFAEGECALLMVILGCILNVTDPLNPTIALPEPKRKELHLLTLTCLARRDDDGRIVLAVDELQSLLGKLNNAVKACKRGRIYLSGLFKRLKLTGTSKADQMITLDPWAERNLIWWAKRLEHEWEPEELFDKIPSLEKKWCGHSDSATGTGYGAFLNRKGGHEYRPKGGKKIAMKEDTCYFIEGKWNSLEKELMATPTEEFGNKRMGINFLEMAAVGMLIRASEAVGFEENRSIFYCDNETTVKVLNSYKTRTLPLASLLENIDLECASRNLNFDYQWIATKLNIESDLLSRGKIEEFKAYIRTKYKIYNFVKLQVPKDAREMGAVCENARRNPHWIVPDGPSKAAPQE